MRECIENVSYDNRFVVGGWVTLLSLHHKRTRRHILARGRAVCTTTLLVLHLTFYCSLTSELSKSLDVSLDGMLFSCIVSTDALGIFTGCYIVIHWVREEKKKTTCA